MSGRSQIDAGAPGAGPPFHKFPKWGCPALPAFFAGGWASAARLQSAWMHVKPVRYQDQGCLHFITFSCYRRMRLLDSSTGIANFLHVHLNRSWSSELVNCRKRSLRNLLQTNDLSRMVNFRSVPSGTLWASGVSKEQEIPLLRFAKDRNDKAIHGAA